MQRYIYLLICILSLPFLALSQGNLYPASFPVFKGVTEMANPWSGGLNIPQFSEGDLNNDGILDLIVYDKSSKTVETFINNGTQNKIDYKHAPEYKNSFPKVVDNFLLARDYDMDGIVDIFFFDRLITGAFGIGVRQGYYDQDTLKFKATHIDLLSAYDRRFTRNPISRIFIINTDLPSISDIDGDGDLDVTTFTSDLSYPGNLFFYKNMSVERGYNGDSLNQFVLETPCMGLFEESGTNYVTLSPSKDSCVNNIYYQYFRRGARHIGASVTFEDYDGDGIQDAFLGGVSYNNVKMVRMQDSSTVATMDTFIGVEQDTFFPSTDKSVDIYSFPSVYFLDVNNDGKRDMIGSPSEMTFGEGVQDSVAWLYLNKTTSTAMQPEYQKSNFLVDGMIEVGANSYPVFADLTGDSLPDLLIGHGGNCQPSSVINYGLTFYENIGTDTTPSFRWVTDDYAGLSAIGLGGLVPTVGDISGDNVPDLLVTDERGAIHFVKNLAGVGANATWDTIQTNWLGLDFMAEAFPQLYDLNGDTKLDLVVGTSQGFIRYYENTGSTKNPFSTVPTEDSLGKIALNNVFPYMRNVTPHFFVDSTGTTNLLIGSSTYGAIMLFDSIDGNTLGAYRQANILSNQVFVGLESAPFTADLNNDSKLEFVFGNNRGGLNLYSLKATKAKKDTSVMTEIILAQDDWAVQVYPNPIQNELALNFSEASMETIEITVQNELGQLLETHKIQPGHQQIQLNTSQWPAGIWFVELRTSSKSKTVPIVKY